MNCEIKSLERRSNGEIEEGRYSGQVWSKEETYRGNSNALLRGIYIELTYNVDKLLGIFWRVFALWIPESLFRLYYCCRLRGILN